MTLRRVAVAAVAWFALIAIAGIVTGRIVTGVLDGVVTGDLDTPFRDWVVGQNEPGWHQLFAHVSAFGTAFVTGTIAVVAGGLWSVRARNPTIALQCATAFAGAGMLTVVVKFGVNRNPASGPLPAFAAGTFPSGHALFAVCVYGTLGTLILRSSGPRVIRVTSATALAVLALAVSWSRVYLLDHFASDVVASVVLGGAWIAVVVSLGNRPDVRNRRANREHCDDTRRNPARSFVPR